jgi:hypothetical protein
VFDADFAVLPLEPFTIVSKFVPPLIKCFPVHDVGIGIEFINVFFKDLSAAVVIRADLGEKELCSSGTLGRRSWKSRNVLYHSLLEFVIILQGGRRQHQVTNETQTVSEKATKFRSGRSPKGSFFTPSLT